MLGKVEDLPSLDGYNYTARNRYSLQSTSTLNTSLQSVCGSDGLTYDNDCQRRSAQCKLKMSIELVKAGPCVKVNI